MVSMRPSPKVWFGAGLPYTSRDELKGKLIVIEGTDGVGRTAQVTLLREWLELRGFSVVETGWTRGRLLGPAITQAKKGNALNPLTFAMMYACDFAERLEGEILPALRAGSIVLSDRYIYTAFARNIVRGLSSEWNRQLYGFALVPDRIFYLDVDLQALVPRVLRARRLNYWEAGVDQFLGTDLYDSFVRYQGKLLTAYHAMKEEFGFLAVDARQSPERIHQEIRAEIETHLLSERRDGNDAAEHGARTAGRDAGTAGGPAAVETTSGS